MPLPTIPMAPFPNVPNARGVPPLARSLTAPVSLTPSLGSNASASVLWQSGQSKPKWAILNSAGVAVVIPDTFMDFSYKSRFNVTKAYVQNGAFASYNKIREPWDIVVRMRKSGTLQDRKVFLDSIEAISGDTNFYTILTPERSYPSLNVSDNEVTRRGTNGAFLLAEVDVFFTQIIQVAAQYSSTATNTQNSQNPSGIPQVNQGPVQPQPVNFIASQQAESAVAAAAIARANSSL